MAIYGENMTINSNQNFQSAFNADSTHEFIKKQSKIPDGEIKNAAQLRLKY